MGRRILVVDDNVDAADTMALLLQVSGHEAVAAYTGADALEKARELEPEVVLLDLLLPDMSGFEVANRLRTEPSTPPRLLVALTGDDSPGALQRTEASAFDHHLVKPVDNARLLELISATGLGARTRSRS